MNQCRICLEEDEISNMISPCLCRGHMKYVHRDCLNQWRVLSGLPDSNNTCPTCKFKYRFEDNQQDCHILLQCVNSLIDIIADSLAGFLIINQLIIFFVYFILLQFNKDDKQTIINKELGLSIENFSIATFITLGNYFILIFIHFTLQKNKLLICKNMESTKYAIFLLIIGVGIILSDFYIVGLLMTSVGTQFIFKKYIEMIRNLQNVNEMIVVSLDDDQIGLLNNQQNRNINYEEIELDEIEVSV